MKIKLTKTFILLLTILPLLTACGKKAVEATEVRVPENRVIYEVFVRNFSPEGNLKGGGTPDSAS